MDPKTFRVSEQFIAGLVKWMQRVIDGPRIKGRFDALEERVAALEARPYVKFCGVWQPGQTYRPGDATTHHGGLWICKAMTPGEPSKDFVGWQLAVKRGSA